jgi:hypothetical protein
LRWDAFDERCNLCNLHCSVTGGVRMMLDRVLASDCKITTAFSRDPSPCRHSPEPGADSGPKGRSQRSRALG